jgi:tRNA threonylcarbamoyladenosine biosynthesis protein TsaE
VRKTGVTIALADLDACASLGAAIASRLRAGDVVALSGGLGAGKTTLARAIIAALGHAGEVPSPTFTIIEAYAPPDVGLPVVHADFYRLNNPADADELGLDEYRAGAALIAEWPEHAGGFAGEPGCLSITLDMLPEVGPENGLENGDAGRIAIVEGGADWLGRMPCPKSPKLQP